MATNKVLASEINLVLRWGRSPLYRQIAVVKTFPAQEVY